MKKVYPYKMPNGKTNILQALNLADAEEYLSESGEAGILFCEVEKSLIDPGDSSDEVFVKFFDSSTGYCT